MSKQNKIHTAWLVALLIGVVAIPYLFTRDSTPSSPKHTNTTVKSLYVDSNVKYIILVMDNRVTGVFELAHNGMLAPDQSTYNPNTRMWSAQRHGIQFTVPSGNIYGWDDNYILSTNIPKNGLKRGTRIQQLQRMGN